MRYYSFLCQQLWVSKHAPIHFWRMYDTRIFFLRFIDVTLLLYTLASAILCVCTTAVTTEPEQFELNSDKSFSLQIVGHRFFFPNERVYNVLFNFYSAVIVVY